MYQIDTAYLPIFILSPICLQKKKKVLIFSVRHKIVQNKDYIPQPPLQPIQSGDLVLANGIPYLQCLFPYKDRCLRHSYVGSWTEYLRLYVIVLNFIEGTILALSCSLKKKIEVLLKSAQQLTITRDRIYQKVTGLKNTSFIFSSFIHVQHDKVKTVSEECQVICARAQ